MLGTIETTFEDRYGLRLVGRLGSGRDGSVFITNLTTAVKFFKSEQSFARENGVYGVLAGGGIFDIAGHAVPELIRADVELLAIEMTVVHRPFLLDFASARPVT